MELLLYAILILIVAYPLSLYLLLEIKYLISKRTCKEVHKYLWKIDSKLSKHVDINDDGKITIDGEYHWEMTGLDYKTVAKNLILVDQIELGIINANKSLDLKQIWKQIMNSDELININNFDFELKKKRDS